MKVFFFDIEIFKNFFCVTFESDINTVIFEFSERKKLDRKKFLDFLKKLENRYGVGFNSIGYDNLILNKAKEMLLLKDWDYLSFCQELKDFSDLIIYGQKLQDITWIESQPLEIVKQLSLFKEELKEEIKQNKFKNLTKDQWFEKIKPYRFTHKWIDIDLLLFWSKGLRLTKQLSLKSIACQLNYPVIQELPIPHDSLVKISQIPSIITYNSVHDIGITRRLFEEMKDEVDLRYSIKQTSGFSCMSWDAPKIASEVLLEDYCKKKFNDTSWERKKEVRGFRFKKERFKIGDHLPVIGFQTDLFKKMYESCRNSYDSFSYNLIVPFAYPTDLPLKLTYGVGGLHNDFKNKWFVSGDEFIVKTSDIESLYPTLIENLKTFRFSEVLNTYLEKKSYRLQITKPNVKKAKDIGGEILRQAKIQDAFYKLLLNGVSGLIDSQHSWLYSNISINILRIYGQMILSRLIEECYINNIQVISANTDGIEIYIHKDQIGLYDSLVKKVEDEFKVRFESEDYKAIYYKNVNNYLAITYRDPKEKGATFVTKPLLGNSNDFLAISKGLKYHLIDGIDIEELFGVNWKNYFTIFDFCASYKIAKTFEVIWNGEKQQQLNRFFVSKKGAYLYKKKKNKNIENVLKGWGVELLNNYDETRQDYSIDFRFYKIKVREILDELLTQQTSMINVW